MGLVRSLGRRGLIGTAAHAASGLADRLARYSPALWWYRRQEARDAAEFDRVRGVDTSGVLALDGLEITSAHRAAGYHYQSCPPWLIRQVIEILDIDYSRFTFIDAGSGKGRPLLIAAEWPFRQVIGVEFARELHEIARRNITSDRLAGRRRCGGIWSCWSDAAKYAFPAGPVVLYMANPFAPEIVDRVLANLMTSPRDVRVLYWTHAGTDHRALFAAHGLEEHDRLDAPSGFGYRVLRPIAAPA